MSKILPFFDFLDENYDSNVKVMSLSELLLNKVNTSQEKAFNWKVFACCVMRSVVICG